MKIMTFNLRSDNIFDINNRWKSRKAIVKNVIDTYKCDIIGIQECTDDMYNDLVKMCKEYTIVGEGRTKKLFKERTCILVSKKYKIIEHSTFWLSRKENKTGSSLWYSLFPRIFTTVLITDSENRNIRICNTHLDCFLSIARKVQLDILMKKVDSLKHNNVPVILMGDFNAKPESTLIKSFRETHFGCGKFKSVCDIQPELYKEGTRVGFKNHKKGDHIDYIFITNQFKIKDVRLIKYNENGKFPSDHYPLFAEINID